MSFLLDENIPESFVNLLKKAGCKKVEHINKVCKGKKDKDVLEYAFNRKYCVISFDSDFYELRKNKHYGIIKFSAKIINIDTALKNILDYIKENGTEDLYYELNSTNAFKDTKVFCKRKPYKFKQFARSYLNLSYLEDTSLKQKKLKKA